MSSSYLTLRTHLCHVSECCIDTSLRGDGMRAGREKLCDACSVEASFCETESCTETGTTSSNNDGIVLVVDDWVFASHDGLQAGKRAAELAQYFHDRSRHSLRLTGASFALKGWFAITRLLRAEAWRERARVWPKGITAADRQQSQLAYFVAASSDLRMDR